MLCPTAENRKEYYLSYNIWYGAGMNLCLSEKKTYVTKGTPVIYSALPYILEGRYYYLSYSADIKEYMTFPHENKANYLFLDGHAGKAGRKAKEVGSSGWYYGIQNGWY